MNMELQRHPTIRTLRGLTTFGDWSIEGQAFCKTLEDAIREDPDPMTLANEGKVYGETAFPAGRYELRFRDSPRFGPRTIEVMNVPGYADVLVHGGTDIDSTLGCIIVGDATDELAGTISGAKVRGVLDKLKIIIGAAIARGERVWLDVLDPGASQEAPSSLQTA